MKFKIPAAIAASALFIIGVVFYFHETTNPGLRTQDFESGAKQLSAVAPSSLERFLQDLNRRKDWDYASHHGQPGPDAAYLFDWVTRTTDELKRRGYYFDSAGQLHRLSTIVALR